MLWLSVSEPSPAASETSERKESLILMKPILAHQATHPNQALQSPYVRCHQEHISIGREVCHNRARHRCHLDRGDRSPQTHCDHLPRREDNQRRGDAERLSRVRVETGGE